MEDMYLCFSAVSGPVPYRDDGWGCVCTQSADFATMRLTINCHFLSCLYVVYLMAYCEQWGNVTAGFT